MSDMTWIALIQKRGENTAFYVYPDMVDWLRITGVHPSRIMVNSNHFGLKAHPFTLW